MPPENPKNQPKKIPAAQKLQEKVKKQVGIGMRAKAERLLVRLDLKKKLTPKNVTQFVLDHVGDQFRTYREWNKNFCESVLEIKDSPPEKQLVSILAMQIFLNKALKGGFSEKPGQANSFDGKLGPFTLGKLKEFIQGEAKKAPKSPSQKPTQSAEINEKFDPKETFYAGDSVMKGILMGRKINQSRRRTYSGSRLVNPWRVGSNAYESYKKRGYIFIEEEAFRHLKNPNCRLLVLNGGVNDLYSAYNPQKVVESIKKSYSTIIKEAHRRGKKVAIYSLNSTFLPKTKETSRIKRINSACREINEWLKSESGADVVLDTDNIAAQRVSMKDGLHMKGVANRDLYQAIIQKTQKRA